MATTLKWSAEGVASAQIYVSTIGLFPSPTAYRAKQSNPGSRAAVRDARWARLARRCPGRTSEQTCFLVCKRVRKAAATKRQPQRAERAIYRAKAIQPRIARRRAEEE